MTTPTVTELPSRREPVSADTFVGDLAIGERRLYGELEVALTALGLHPLPTEAPLEVFEADEDVVQER